MCIRDSNVDAVGACIGPRGARVGKIVEELGGEKIDIVEYSEEPEKFIAASLSPADVISVEAVSYTHLDVYKRQVQSHNFVKLASLCR